MRCASLAFLLLFLAACTTSRSRYYDRVEPRAEELPVIELGLLAGQDVQLELQNEHGLRIRDDRDLYDDLERALLASGVRVVKEAPLKLRVKYTLMTADRRTFQYQACGRLEGQLLRENTLIGQPFTSDYCNEASPDRWRYPYRRTEAEREAFRARAYHELLRVFLNDLERAAAKG